MGVKFKDKRSGNVYEYELPFDIEAMRKHDEYEEVKEEPKQDPPKQVTKK